MIVRESKLVEQIHLNGGDIGLTVEVLLLLLGALLVYAFAYVFYARLKRNA